MGIFTPKMDIEDLLEGYKKIIQNIYSIEPYYERVRQLLRNYKRPENQRIGIELVRLKAFFKSVYIIGLRNKGRREYWKLLIWTLLNRPCSIVNAITYIVYGYHYRKIYGLAN
jgi:hypothetical protein